LRNSAVRSASLSGASASVGRALRLNLWPSRVKIRSSRLAASAIRASVGTSRRQSGDHSSEITSTLAGPFG
jgi:hypothetical protein